MSLLKICQIQQSLIDYSKMETIQTEVGKVQVVALDKDLLSLSGRNLKLNGVEFQMTALFRTNGFTSEYAADSLTTQKTKLKDKYRKHLSAVSCQRLIEILKQSLDMELRVRPEFLRNLQETYYREKINQIKQELQKKEEEVQNLKSHYERVQAELSAR